MCIRGDMLYVAAGTVHTIGGGMVLVETQQTSDITYRLYDYGRPRELHIKEGLAAIKLHTERRESGSLRERCAECSGAVAILPSREDQAARTAARGDVARLRRTSWSRSMALGIVESQGMAADQLRDRRSGGHPGRVREYTVRPQWELGGHAHVAAHRQW